MQSRRASSSAMAASAKPLQSPRPPNDAILLLQLPDALVVGLVGEEAPAFALEIGAEQQLAQTGKAGAVADIETGKAERAVDLLEAIGIASRKGDAERVFDRAP
jgi:hypothetical protein